MNYPRPITLLLSIALIALTITACKKSTTDPAVTPPATVPPVVTEPVLLPTISNFSPSKIMPNGSVSIVGTNFDADVTKLSVTVGGVPAIIHANTTSELLVTVPSTAKTGKIIVASNGKAVTSGTELNIAVGMQSTFSNGLYERIAIAKNGDIFLTDGARLYKAKVDGSYVLFAGSSDNTGPFTGMIDIAVDPSGNVFVLDTKKKVYKVSPDGTVTLFAGSGSYPYKDGQGAEAAFYNGTSITTDNAGNVYVGETSAIRKITPGGLVTNLAGDNSFKGRTDGQGKAAHFTYIGAMTTDAENNIYVADASNCNIRKVTPEGLVSTVAGSGVQGFVNGYQKAAQFFSPFGIAIDKAGNIFVSDPYNSVQHQIRMINKAGYVSTVINSVGQNIALKNGPLDQASTSWPIGMCFDPNGNLFICNTGSGFWVSKITFN